VSAVDSSFSGKARVIGLYSAIVGLALIARLSFLFAADCVNSDATIVPLMARHFARGDFTPYFWGQRYMGALEPLLLTPLAPFGLATATANVAFALVIGLIQLGQTALLTRRVGAPPWLAALLFALPPGLPLAYQMALWGARHVATCLGLWALDRALAGKLENPRGAALTGVILGVAFFGDHLTVAFAAPVLYVAWRMGSLRRVLATIVPFVLLDVVLSTTSAAGRHSLPQDPRDWFRGIRLFTTSAVPRTFGFEWVDPVLRLQAGPLWVLASLACLVSLGVFLVISFRKLRGTANDPGLLGPRLFAGVLLLLGALHVIGALDEESARYLTLGFAPFAALFAWTMASIPRWQAALLVTGLLLPRLPSEAPLHKVNLASATACRADLAELARAIDRLGARALFTDYWDAYRLALASNERWPIGTALRASRHPCWNHQARAATPVAYLAPSSQHVLYEKVTRAAPGVRWIELGRRRIALLERALPGLDGPESREPPAGCLP
jgi:hypothetical protein